MGRNKQAMKLVVNDLKESAEYHRDASDMAKALLKLAKKKELTSKDLREADNTFMGIFEDCAYELDNPGESILSEEWRRSNEEEE